MSEYARYFTGYPANIVEQVLSLISNNKVCDYLLKKYPQAHTITSDKLLYSYATELKKQYLKNAPPFGRAAFKKQGDMITNALGTHTYRMQGKTRKHDLAINSDLLRAPEPLLKALVVHELAHFKEKDHNIFLTTDYWLNIVNIANYVVTIKCHTKQKASYFWDAAYDKF